MDQHYIDVSKNLINRMAQLSFDLANAEVSIKEKDNEIQRLTNELEEATKSENNETEEV